MSYMPIFYSPSAQEHNVGQGVYGTEESEMNSIADIGIPGLKNSGFNVFRNNREDNLNSIITMSNRLIGYNGIHLAVHSNATGLTSSTKRGCTVYYCKGSVEGKKLATEIYNELSALTPVTDVGIKESDYYGELRLTHSIAVIVEVEYHDSIDGAKWIMNNKIPIAHAINRGLCKYCNVEYKPIKEEDNMRGIILLYSIADVISGVRLMRKLGYPMVTIDKITNDEKNAKVKIQIGGSTKVYPDVILISGATAEETDNKVTEYIVNLKK